ncbi:MAG TPA: phage baseplate assembly protein V [Solirubrobacteraceae bacterium]|nr:phage baseplate assembly protein V [Solirubrobacteraceae bacterium]
MSREQELSRRIAMGTTRGRMALVDDKKKLQQVQVELLADETKDHVERFQQYGFTSVPLEGAEAVVSFLGGGRDHGIVLAIDDRRYRQTEMQAGDVALYTDEKTRVVLTRDQTIKLACALLQLAGVKDDEPADEVTIKTKKFTVECETLELTASDSITVTSPSVDVNK